MGRLASDSVSRIPSPLTEALRVSSTLSPFAFETEPENVRVEYVKSMVSEVATYASLCIRANSVRS